MMYDASRKEIFRPSLSDIRLLSGYRHQLRHAFYFQKHSPSMPRRCKTFSDALEDISLLLHFNFYRDFLLFYIISTLYFAASH